MIVINSAAYVDTEFRNELGEIPPCFLPLGNKKLLEHQVGALREIFSDPIIVSLPDSYELSLDECSLMEALQVRPLPVPDDLTLAEALVYVLNVVRDNANELRLLHGDTLIFDLPLELDVVSVSISQENYDWEFESGDSCGVSDAMLVWSGFFSFSDKGEFLKNLVLSRGDFVNAVRGYGRVHLLEKHRCNNWFDLGHINTYFITRSRDTTQRAFNLLQVSDGVLYKSGEPPEKIDAEARWLLSVPPIIKKYTPNLLDSGRLESGRAFYALEFLPYLPLNELFVHGRNPVSFWALQLQLLQRYLIDSRQAYDPALDLKKSIEQDAQSLYEDKTFSRLKEYASKNVLALSVVIVHKGHALTVEQMAQDCIRRVLSLPVIPAVLHGDFCFSNILFDSRSRRLKVVDPRAINSKGEFSIYGDQKYDLAKLAHSVMGLYDFIIAGRYTIFQDDSGQECINFEASSLVTAVQKMFMATSFIDGFKNADVIPVVVLLFLSMLPLHDDQPARQKGMLLNAIRLYKEFV